MENKPVTQKIGDQSGGVENSINLPLVAIANSPVELDKLNLESIKSDMEVMINFAVNNGKELPTNLMLKSNEDISVLIADYNTLRKVIAPATPASLRYINAEILKKGKSGKWYSIPIFTKCIIIAMVALLILIGVSLSPIVSGANQAKGLLSSSGMPLFINLVFICSASLLGVMFFILKSIIDKIRNYSLLPIDSIELNPAIIIGVISGFVITELFTFTLTGLGNDYIEIQKMSLALVGGFSSDAIFSILQGVVNKFKGLFSS